MFHQQPPAPAWRLLFSGIGKARFVADVEVQGEYQFERRPFGSNPAHLRSLAEWLIGQQVEEIVTEIDSTILETGLGSTGTVLETHLPEMRRR
jgi:hypothetical protein